ncbi:hypothetical protein PSHT_06729, partial [Puccinia striiformis]
MVRLSYKYHTRHDLCPTANDATPFFFAAGLRQLDVKQREPASRHPSNVDGRLLPEPRSLLQLSYTCNQNVIS